MNDTEYLNAVRAGGITTIARWRTTTCPECQMLVHRTEDGEDAAGHVIVNGTVAIGCEGYWVISPAALGLPVEWEDWTEDEMTCPEYVTCAEHGRVNITRWSGAGATCTLTYSCGCTRTATPADFEAMI